MGFGFTRWTEWEEKCSSTMPRRFSVCGHDHVNDHLWLQWQRCSSFIITIAGERQKGEKRREMTGGLTMEFVIVLSVLSGWTCVCVCVYGSSASWCLMRQKRGSFMILGINWSQSIPEDQSGIFFGGWPQRKMIKKDALGEKKKKKKGWDQTYRGREESLNEEEVTPVPLLVYSRCITVRDYGGTKWVPDGFGKPLNSTSSGSHWEMIASEVFEVCKRPVCIDRGRKRWREKWQWNSICPAYAVNFASLYPSNSARMCVLPAEVAKLISPSGPRLDSEPDGLTR